MMALETQAVLLDEPPSSTENFNVLQENNALMNTSINNEMVQTKADVKRLRPKMQENFFPISQNMSNNNSLVTKPPISSLRLISKPDSFNLEQVRLFHIDFIYL